MYFLIPRMGTFGILLQKSTKLQRVIHIPQTS
jgi:hypothetical protein